MLVYCFLIFNGDLAKIFDSFFNYLNYSIIFGVRLFELFLTQKLKWNSMLQKYSVYLDNKFYLGSHLFLVLIK